MDIAYESKYHELEEQHWWFASRRHIVFDIIQKLNLPKNARILEIGCSGGPLQLALREVGFQDLTGIDISETGIALAKKRGLTNVSVMDGAKLDFPDASFDLVIASDVLEHIEDENRAVSEWQRVLRPGGQLLVFVPAFQQLWSSHDVVNYHFRRYSAEHLTGVLRKAGLQILRHSYWNLMLFFPTAIMRLAQRAMGRHKAEPKGTGDLYQLPGPLNGVLRLMVKGENVLLRSLNFPVGVSVFALAQKPKA